MGNFSRNPKERLNDTIAKKYVGVRLQQGVPILDADWNLMEDLLRHQLETIGTHFIGSGVPTGSDGFRIMEDEGDDNFSIKQGVILVNGRVVANDNNTTFRAQEGFNDALSETFKTPTQDTDYIVYLDTWEEEAGELDDNELVDDRIEIETCVRLKRTWLVRVAITPADLNILKNPPEGHAFYQLARISRKANNKEVTGDMIEDIRDTQLSVIRRIDVRDHDDKVTVHTRRFAQMLENTRDNVMAFVQHITTRFNQPTTQLMSAEIMGLQVAGHIAQTAETGIGLISCESLANRGALNFLSQLYHAEKNFVTTWQAHVIPLMDGTEKKYASYVTFIQRMEKLLHDPMAGQQYHGLLPSLQRGDIESAVNIQEQIAGLIGTHGGDIPHGTINVIYTKPPVGNLTDGDTTKFEFRVESFTTSGDFYTVDILPEDGWQRLVVDAGGNEIPGSRVSLGADGSETTFYVDVTVEPGECDMYVRVASESNPDIHATTGVLKLIEGEPPPPGEEKVQLQVINVVNGAYTDGVVKIVTGKTCVVKLLLYNNTGIETGFNLSLLKIDPIGDWTCQIPGSSTLPPVGNNDTAEKSIMVKPGSNADSLQLEVSAESTEAQTEFSGRIVIPVKAVTSL